jgi:histone H4
MSIHTVNLAGFGTIRVRRHRKVFRDTILGITKATIRKLARRGGVKRISGLIYEETRSILCDFVRDVIHGAIIYCDYADRRTITALDVVRALKKQGRTIYGFGE